MLPVQYRLRDRNRIKEIFSLGKSAHSSSFVLYALANEVEHPRFTFIASKKIGNSVERHRAVRLLRESVRLEIGMFSALDYVVIAKKPLLESHINEIQQQFKRLIS